MSDVSYTRYVEFQYLKILHSDVVNAGNNVVNLTVSFITSFQSANVWKAAMWRVTPFKKFPILVFLKKYDN